MIDGKAVVPLALMAEWFAHAALHENPGLLLQGLEDMRVLNGIRLKEDSKLIRLFAGKARRRQGVYEVDLELRNGVREGKDILHSRARATWPTDTLRRRSTGCPRASPATTTRARRPRSTRKFSSTGNGCTACARCSAAMPPAWWPKSWGRRSRLIGSPPPCGTPGCATRSCSTPPSRWRACGVTSSTATCRCPATPSPTRQFRTGFPAAGVVVALEVTDATAKRMRGDFTFLDGRGEVVARLTGYEAVMDPLLNRAFKPDAPPAV